MVAILGTWNPANWSWAAYDKALRLTSSGGKYSTEWSVHHRRHGVGPGNRFFLLRQGVEPRGIVASGTITSVPVAKAHWNGTNGATTNYITVELDTILDVHDIFEVERLKAELPNTHWTPQASGTTIKADDEKLLEQLWADHIQASVS